MGGGGANPVFGVFLMKSRGGTICDLKGPFGKCIV